MFWKIFHQELLLLRHSKPFIGIVIFISILSITATINGILEQGKIDSKIQNLIQEEFTIKQTIKNTLLEYELNPSENLPVLSDPGVVGFSLLAHHVALPQRLLSVLSRGQSDVQPYYYRVTLDSSHTFINRSEITNPINLLSGGFDLAFVITFLLPVLILLLTFDLVSRDRETGTLALILAQGVPQYKLVSAKCFSLAFVILILLLFLTLVISFMIRFNHGAMSAWGELAVWFAITASYSLFWFALALFVNAFKLPSTTNGLVLSNLWLIIVIIIPACINLLATTFYPAPSRVMLTTEMREASAMADQHAAIALEEFFFDHPEITKNKGTNKKYFVEVLAKNESIENFVQPIITKFDKQAKARERLIEKLQFLSPAALTQASLSKVAQTDNLSYLQFQSQVLVFHRAWREFFVSFISANKVLSANSINQLPQFSYNPKLNAPSRPTISRSLGGLLIYITFLIIVAWRKYSHYQIH